ncbi:PSD1 and planctomycete cytochrome C domain-containing protein [Bremerella sp. T1]|uniref:PSD1 and planctomycete cytochrome C domain-containing protein n=1 Tax=Bremerella sp. TYQ1 TaxID=3119568 RepID=UPI001CCCFC3B|nr:PSD1 and planctomycete cytochrome C domain-containing protein [Bremerella volcania]UBM38351.1 PSD1 and planctomycete cytochrome C domain-containing protein [Bremerella volcania]
MTRFLVACCLLLLLTSGLSAETPIVFNRDVRPILSDRCFACHGPDASSRAADLRLDDRESATQDLGGHRAIVEGNANQSELIRRVTSSDEFEVMPPPEHGEPLTSTEIGVLRQWINQGARYQKHWSFESLKRPAVPAGAAHPVDAFVRSQLKSTELTPSAQADPRILARRLAFDITGLPPETDVVDTFVTSPTDANYQSMVNQLLESPHYGERMAIYWLDLVRYADTLGYHGDQPRSVSPYRDYVIEAFNENKPFDQFTIEQLAGDLLPEATLTQKVASTYNRLNRASGEGGVQPKEYLAKYSADRVRTTGAVWLGLTTGCAECHDHKFDPITARDFYSFAAFFADIKEQGIVRSAMHVAQLPVPTPEQEQQLALLNKQIQEAEERYQQRSPEIVAARIAWEKKLKDQTDHWQIVTPREARSEGNAKLDILEDGSVLASGKNPDRDVYLLTVDAAEFSSQSGLIALRLELMPDKSLPKSGPGRASNGNLVLHAVEMVVNNRKVKWDKAVASHSQKNHSPQYVVDRLKNGWAILPQTGKPQQLILSGHVLDDPSSEEIQTKAYEIRLRQNHGGGHNLGRFRLSVSRDAEAVTSLLNIPGEVRQIAGVPADERTPDQQATIDTIFREQTPLLKETRDLLSKLRQDKEKLEKSIVTTLATTATDPRTIRILPRGNWMDDSGEVVDPAVPHFLPPFEQSSNERLTRLDLAKWMTSKNNPLVARTFVNRVWMLFFGQGLSRTVDDLGSQGQPPTHPELLDWLADEFIESGWDVKHLIKLIVTSETYRQSSNVDAEARKKDPYNLQYSRQSRWRLDAEMIRDNALSVSGLLNPAIGGASAKPYQPAGYWAQLNFPKRTYQHDTGPNQYRRGVYTHWQRTFLHPSMLAFDAPAREECTAQRSRSNTPLQSLVLLNDPTFVEAARALATETIRQDANDFADRLSWMIHKTLMRAPRPEEVTLLKQLYQTDLARYRSEAEAAQQIVTVGMTPVPEDIDQAELAAWTSVARTLLNLHETITRY